MIFDPCMTSRDLGHQKPDLPHLSCCLLRPDTFVGTIPLLPTPPHESTPTRQQTCDALNNMEAVLDQVRDVFEGQIVGKSLTPVEFVALLT